MRSYSFEAHPAVVRMESVLSQQGWPVCQVGTKTTTKPAAPACVGGSHIGVPQLGRPSPFQVAAQKAALRLLQAATGAADVQVGAKENDAYIQARLLGPGGCLSTFADVENKPALRLFVACGVQLMDWDNQRRALQDEGAQWQRQFDEAEDVLQRHAKAKGVSFAQQAPDVRLTGRLRELLTAYRALGAGQPLAACEARLRINFRQLQDFDGDRLRNSPPGSPRALTVDDVARLAADTKFLKVLESVELREQARHKLIKITTSLDRMGREISQLRTSRRRFLTPDERRALKQVIWAATLTCFAITPGATLENFSYRTACTAISARLAAWLPVGPFACDVQRLLGRSRRRFSLDITSLLGSIDT